MNQILTGSKIIAYKLRQSARAKRVRISVSCDSGVVVTIPFGIRGVGFENFLKEKANWILSKLNYFESLRKYPVFKVKKAEYRKLKFEAWNLAVRKLIEWNKFYNLSYNRISIKNQKTRWGSCSKKGNLNFNYKIVHLPEHLLDYLIVHELCHLKELNHSKKFWNLVAYSIPDYVHRKRELRLINVLKY